MPRMTDERFEEILIQVAPRLTPELGELLDALATERSISEWLAEFAADTIKGVNEVFLEAFGDEATMMAGFQPSAEELIADAEEATK